MPWNPGHLEALNNARQNGHNYNWTGLNPNTYLRHLQNDELLAQVKNIEYLNNYSKIDVFNFVGNHNDNLLACCFVIFSWGGMGLRRRNGLSNFENAMATFNNYQHILEGLRNNNYNKIEAYQEFYNLSQNGNLPGMGPAYYTKLIHFFTGNLEIENQGFIMDQWTAKSMNLLKRRVIGYEPINLSNGYVNANNNQNVYSQFCENIIELANELSQNGNEITPYETEQLIFSNGGRNRGQWRQHVIQSY